MMARERDPLESQRAVIKTRRYCLTSAPADYHFVIECVRFDGECFNIAVRSLEDCAALLYDWVPDEFSVKCAPNEDQGAIYAALQGLISTDNHSLH